MSRFWSPIVERLSPYTPGEQPKDRTFVKLNTNENPHRPSPRALEAIRAAADDGLRLYPDPTASDLRQAIGARFGFSPDHVFAGNGSDEVLAHAFNAFFGGGRPILFADTTYSFYRTYCGLYAIDFREVPLNAAFEYDPADYRPPCGGIVIANPNAPTGLETGLSTLKTILANNPDVVVIADEAYVDFGAESAVELVPDHDNLLVVQTFSKARSLAGLRVGFAIAQPPLIEGLMRVKDSFNSYPLGRLALAGALAAWNDLDWFETTRQRVMADRARMTMGLVALGFRVLPSATNFVFVSHGSVPAVELVAGLRERGILVRHFNKPRVRNWLRISVGTEEECARLVDEVAGLVGELG